MEPVVESRWLAHAEPMVNARSAAARSIASAGRNGDASRFSGETRVTATSTSAMTLGVLTVQSLPPTRRAPARCMLAIGYCSAPRFGGRNGSVRSVIWSSLHAQ